MESSNTDNGARGKRIQFVGSKCGVPLTREARAEGAGEKKRGGLIGGRAKIRATQGVIKRRNMVNRGGRPENMLRNSYSQRHVAGKKGAPRCREGL